MRGVAVLAVVLYHAGVGAVPGGYVGVDVFFVLSGYLITGLILRDLNRPDGFSFISFYARRARRILPAATVVLIATVLCSVAWLAPLQARSVTKDSLASALFVSNYRFATVGTDYLTTASPSPLQHYWSLCIEEQFYLLWPALMVATVLLGRRLRFTALPAIVLAIITVDSFWLGLRLTTSNPPWAYFSLASRGWELAAGGLLALAGPLLGRRPALLVALLGWLGLAALGYSIVGFTAATAFPGVAALLPVLGTLLLITSGAGSGRLGPGSLLSRRAPRYLGRISYSWYLWHWPVLLLAPAALGHPLRLHQSLLLAAGSAMLAALTLRLVENPIRYSGRLRVRPRLALALGAVLLLCGVGASHAAAGRVPDLTSQALASAPAPLAGSPRSDSGGGLTGAPATSPQLAALAAADRRIAGAVAASLTARPVPGNLDPPLDQAAGDKAAPFVDGCNLSWTDVQQPPCSYGSGSRRIVLFGDSHAAQWFPALSKVAGQRHWQLQSFTKTTCPPNELPLYSPYLDRQYVECQQWRTSILARLRTERPAVVVLGVARHYSQAYHVTVYDRSWNASLAATVSELRASGAAVLVMGPTPKPPTDVPTCLSGHLSNEAGCAFDYRSAVQVSGMAAERLAVRHAGGGYLDVPSWICTSRSCAAVVGNLLVYRDDNHLSTTFTSWLAPAVSLAIYVALSDPAAMPE